MRTFDKTSPWVQALTDAERRELDAAASQLDDAHKSYAEKVEKLRNRAKARLRRGVKEKDDGSLH